MDLPIFCIPASYLQLSKEGLELMQKWSCLGQLLS
jgi:hypothetical protein